MKKGDFKGLGAGRPLFDGPYSPKVFERVSQEMVGSVSIETYRPR